MVGLTGNSQSRRAAPPSVACQNVVNDSCHALCKQWRNCVADLLVLLGAGTFEVIVIRERLKACSFSRCEATTLRRVVVNVIMSVLADVRDDRGGRFSTNLHSEAISKWRVLLVSVG